MQLWVTLLVTGRETITYAPPPLRDLLVGRDESVNDVILHEPQVSRMHARLIARPNGFAIQDLGSKTGTFVNDARVADRRLLMSGDVVGIGPFQLRVRIKPWVRRDEDETTATMNGVLGLGLDDGPAPGGEDASPVPSENDEPEDGSPHGPDRGPNPGAAS